MWIRAAVTAFALLLVSSASAYAEVPSHHTVTARGAVTGDAAELVIRDDDLVGRPIVKATYVLYDGYAKTVVIPHGGAPLKAVDIADCHRAGVPSSPPWRCGPMLHRTEVIYGDTGGHRFGSPDHFHAGIHATETAAGGGDFLTVGEIDHGGMVRITYEDAGGDTFTIELARAKAILVYRVLFEAGKGYSARLEPLPARNF